MSAAPAGGALALAERLALRLAGVPGVRAVVLGGSHARGTASADSDIDLGIYYHPSEPIDLGKLQALADELDDRRGEPQSDRGAERRVTRPGEWGLWVNGGAWLRVDGVAVDWLYRDLERVRDVVGDCLAGRLSADYYLGHPHAFHNHIYLAEVALCRPLVDEREDVGALKALALPYPRALQRAIVARYLFDARFTLAHAEKPAARGDTFVVAGDLFRAVAALVQVLFALNETYFPNEKGALALTGSFPHCPPGFAEEAQRALACPGDDAAALTRSVGAARALAAQVEAQAQRLGL